MSKRKPDIDVILGDCREVLQKASPNFFEAVVTSVPYNTGQDYGSYNDKKPFSDYLAEMEQAFYGVYKVMRPTGLFFLNVGNCHSDKMGLLKAHTVVAQAIKIGFHAIEEIIWVKSITVEGENYGHFTPVQGKRLNPMFEYIFVLAKNKDKFVFNREKLYVPYTDKSNVGRYSETDGRCIGDIWYMPYPTKGKTKKKNYPALFPLELPKRCLRLAKRGPVLDPFCGGGTTGIAAASLGRDAVLIDINPEAIEQTKSRVNRYLKKRKKK